METVFDHNPTPDELAVLFGEVPPTREEFEALGFGAETQNAYLHDLFRLRGDTARAEEYVQRISDPLYRFNVGLHDVVL